ncbi:sulfotransferase family 2 domain-containing protein [Maridesulfovibrio sp.]|uniref:sulfotransferase family 2 domain-containing protein n=1 Tax=Maridesulfovibrio sp. TaxID=2795000 RepID=UPI002A18E5B4|nr:sulfotransferase family 2 domain-containing protein [Maridesulfovibrio sp.]
MKYNYIHNLDDIEFGSDVVIYGLGGTAKELFFALNRTRPDVNIRCFMDSTSCSGELCCIPVFNVGTLNMFKDCKVVVASVFYEEIAEKLYAYGCKDFSVFVEHCCFLDVYRDLFEIPEKKMSIFSSLPDMEDDDCLYVFNVSSRADGPGAVRNVLGDCTSLPLKHFFVDLLDYDHEQTFAAIDLSKVKDICIIDINGRKTQLAALAAYITSDLGRSISIYKSPIGIRNFSVIEGRKLLFLEICKNGASSSVGILRQIFDKYKDQCFQFKELRNCSDITDPYFEDYLKFAIVRNPYERLASLYAHVMREAPNKFLYPLLSKIVGQLNFEDFCRIIATCPDEFSDVHFMSQTAHLTLPEGLLDDFTLLRLENFADDMKSFFSALGEEIEIPHKNKSRPDKVDYIEDYYTPELIKLVNERYEDDFINFGYKFL